MYKALHIFISVSLISIISCQTKSDSNKRYFSTSDSSLVQYQVPEWYIDAKLGYWVTWGIYSVPAYAGDHAAEWYGRWMYNVYDSSGNDKGYSFDSRGLKTAMHHREKYGDPSEFGYKDFIPMFKAEKFDADEWADLFQQGGAKFFTMMAMHHDNFCLWDSEEQHFNSVNMGPQKDFVKAMKEATQARGMKFGVSNHSAWNGHFFEYNHRNGFDGLKNETQNLYGNGTVDSAAICRWWRITTELVNKYQPDLYYFDWGWNIKPFAEEHRRNFLEYYYNKAIDWNRESFPSPDVVINYKNRKKLPAGSAVLDLERGGMIEKEERVWQNDTSLGLHSWSYSPDEEYRSANQVIDMLMDIISKNGILLLNIGPKADGTIPLEAKIPILEIGQWLNINGEAVYATRPWEVFGDGPTTPSEKMHGDQVEYSSADVRFTQNKSGNILYATFLGYPGKEAILKQLNSIAFDMSELNKITLLGLNQTIDFTQTKKGLTLHIPTSVQNSSFAYSFKLEFINSIPQLND
ncbi:alpha-L-fucosidase [Reichenbachiella versicolor]|uniref:alpha-L-fucosidase n=1 Tax=Reichenbachiella versicolor TaxID=1821036 RepID=UPI000D6DE16B|nr:alpha-L-fucosidase [Reichenbachiella versicolor]